MTEDDRWNYLLKLDDELIVGGVILSEWCSFIVREADTAFARGAHLASILTAVSAIETHLRAEHGADPKETLASLIDRAVIDQKLSKELHSLRKYRNKWVHVSEPWFDQEILKRPERYAYELEEMSLFSVRILRQVLYHNQCV